MTNETKQTIVDWIEHQVKQQGITHYFSLREILEKAKEIEKQKTIEFTNNWYNCYFHTHPMKTPEQFYNETYGGNK